MSPWKTAVLLSALVCLITLAAPAKADVLTGVSLAAPAYPIALSPVEQNVINVSNPTAQPLVFSVPAMDFKLAVPAGESRRVMVDQSVLGGGNLLSYNIEGNRLLQNAPIIAPVTSFVAAQPFRSARTLSRTQGRNLASVRSICGESRLVTIEEPCPYDPPVNVFFAGELPPPPPPKKPVRGYW